MTVHNTRFDQCLARPSCEPQPPVAKPPCCESGVGTVRRAELPVKRVGWETFLGNVAYEAKGVPDDVAADYVRSAAIHFARRAAPIKRRWFMDVTPGFEDYYPQVHASEEINRIEMVCLDGQCLDLDGRPHCSARFACGCGTATVSFELPDVLRLEGLASCSMNCNRQLGQLEVYGTVFPSESACEFDELLYRYHHAAIKARALHELFKIPGREWTNFALAKHWDTQANSERAWAKTEQANSRMAQRGPLHQRMEL
jgi:hypothetical protein